MNGEPSRTALFDCHTEAGAKMVDFHGFELPIWYSSIQEEHLATRASAGLFDVSHMGFFRFCGEDVRSWLSSIATQEYLNFPSGRCGYTHFLDHDGLIIDDMIFAIKSEIEVLGVPNASMVPVMLDWFNSLIPEDGSITLENLSARTSILALQGPASARILAKVIGQDNTVSRFACQEIAPNALGIEGWIQGTGYTGEKGYEIFVANQQAPLLWNALLKTGRAHGLVPVGLGARDTLRLEKGYLLSGQDFIWPGLGSSAEPPLPEDFLYRDTAETAVPFGLDLEHEFIGKGRVVQSIESGDRWHGLECLDRGPAPRPGHAVLSSDEDDAVVVGRVTSGAPSPSKERTGIAMAYLSGVDQGSEVWIQTSPRRRVKALVKRPPFI
ncbi:MAG: aminomethyltransferase family protein [Candidatus Thalassarchaeum sp.]